MKKYVTDVLHEAKSALSIYLPLITDGLYENTINKLLVVGSFRWTCLSSLYIAKFLGSVVAETNINLQKSRTIYVLLLY